MKKILSIVLLILLLCSNSYAAVKKGKGEVTLSNQSVDWLIKYIRGKGSKKPMAFILSSNGAWSSYWYCGEGACRDGNFMPTIRKCEADTDTECGIFARRRTILWDNGVKPKKAVINSKWSDQEIKDKLKEWGFLGGSTSSTTTTTPKITKKKNGNKGSTVEQLETLAALFKAGSLTKEEYDKAKKKVLSD